MLEVFDNFFDTETTEKIFNHCLTAKYTVGENDGPNLPPTGMVSEICDSEEIYEIFLSQIEKKIDHVKDRKMYRMYINLFSSNENPHFHTDGKNGFTCLYYVNPYDPCYTLDLGGETQFIVNDQIAGILPLTNRMVCFDANILHRATSFRFGHRLTIAIKFK